MFENAGGTEADVGQTRSWSLSVMARHTMEQQNKVIHLKQISVV